MNKFMGKEWENEQLEKLKRKQEVRIAELKKQAIQEVTVQEVKSAKEVEALKNDSTSPDVKKNDPNQLPPEQA
jgi:UDP-galactopyranose mutase